MDFLKKHWESTHPKLNSYYWLCDSRKVNTSQHKKKTQNSAIVHFIVNFKQISYCCFSVFSWGNYLECKLFHWVLEKLFHFYQVLEFALYWMLVATRTIVKAFGLLVNWEMSAEKYICTNLNANNSHHNSTLKTW